MGSGWERSQPASFNNLAGNRWASAHSRLIWDVPRLHYTFMPNEKVTRQSNGQQQSGMWGCQASSFLHARS